jgi:hypothetical protein
MELRFPRLCLFESAPSIAVILRSLYQRLVIADTE